MSVPDQVLVIGHRNPDMDAIAAAIGYAWLLDAIGEVPHIAGRTGQLNAQTTWALERFNVPAPELVTEVRPRIGDLVEALDPLPQGATIISACQRIAQTRRSVPVIGDAQKPLGLLTGAGLFAHLADALSSASVLALAREFEQAAANAVDADTPQLYADDFVRDLLGKIMRSEYDEFLVIDDTDAYRGIVRKSALMSPPRQQVIMVDHNELEQSVPGLEEATVIEVLDHHRLSTIPTAVPIRFHVDPVGSTSTLVTERAGEFKQVFPPGIAGVLLCGILSDTLIFRSPTTTPRDRAAAAELALMSGIANMDDTARLTAIQEVGEALLSAGGGLGTRAADEVVSGDIKFYHEYGVKIGIAQVEVSTFSELEARLGDLRDALGDLVNGQELALALLMITDVVRGNSRLIARGQGRILTALPYKRLPDDTMDAPGVMSRKKQLLPTVLAALAQTL